MWTKQTNEFSQESKKKKTNKIIKAFRKEVHCESQLANANVKCRVETERKKKITNTKWTNKQSSKWNLYIKRALNYLLAVHVLFNILLHCHEIEHSPHGIPSILPLFIFTFKFVCFQMFEWTFGEKKKNNYFRTRRRKKNTNCIFFLYEMLAKYDAIILLANGHRPFSATFIGSKRISVLNHFFLISNVPQVSVVVVFFLNPLKCANYKIDWNLWDGTVLNFAFLLQIN